MIGISVRPQLSLSGLTLAVLAASTMLLSACGNHNKGGASQTAAKVNKEEITVHQVNFAQQQQRGLRPEQVPQVRKQILERLIDQEIALQKAEELKLDRNPTVVQQIEAARREIIAKAYVDHLGEGATKPSPEEVKKYYEDHPALFRERRVYALTEFAVQGAGDALDTVRKKAQEAHSSLEFNEYLKTTGLRWGGNQVTRAAEQLPLSTLDSFAKLREGQSVVVPAPGGAQVFFLQSSRLEPVDEARARPAIEAFLVNDAKRRMLEANLKTLRDGAKIEYIGEFAGGPSVPASAPKATPATAAASASTSASGASGLSTSDITKGMGLNK